MNTTAGLSPRTTSLIAAASGLVLILALTTAGVSAYAESVPSRRAPAAPKITPAAAEPGSTVRATGKLRPRAKRPVALQRKLGRKWLVVARGKSDAKGRYRFATQLPAKDGVYSYRVVAKAGKFRAGKKTRRLPKLVTRARSVTARWVVRPNGQMAPLVNEDAPEAIEGQYIVALKERPGSSAASASQGSSITRATSFGGTVVSAYGSAVSGYSARLTDEALTAIRRDPRVAYVGVDQVVRGSTAQSDAPWGLDRSDQRDLPLDGTYRYTQTGSGVDVYVIDSGIRRTHTEVAGRVASGFDAVRDGRGTGDCAGHGTHVAATIGGTTYGIAKAVKLIPVRVLDCNDAGSASGVIAGVDWVTSHHVPGRPAVANMSLALGGVSDVLDAAINTSIRDGVTYVAAAGNDSSDACDISPARVPSLLTVGAIGDADRRWSSSNYGGCLDLFAPGEGIVSAGITSDTSTARLSGTSMASPHVAGAAALYFQSHPTATAAQVASAIIANTTDGKVSNAGNGSPNRLLHVPSATPVRPPVIATETVPSARVGVLYATDLVVADGRRGTWAITSGSPPPGLHLTGSRIAGTPVSAGTSTFTVTFTGDGTAIKTLTLLVEAIPAPVRNDWVSLTTGDMHTCGIRTNGTAWCWGENYYGMLGDGTTNPRRDPTLVAAWTDWISISAGVHHTCGLRSNGTAWCWGGNYVGQLGDGTFVDKVTPTQVGSGTDWATLTAGDAHTCGLQVGGRAWCWGYNNKAQLGDPSGDGHQNRARPVAVGGDVLWQSLSAGTAHTCGIQTTGAAWCWGSNDHGQAGDGTTTYPAYITRISESIGSWRDWTSITAGGDHSCGVRSDGTLWCWGANHLGQVGDGTTVDRSGPRQVGTGKNWTSVTTGYFHSCGLRVDRTLWCWGNGTQGQRGDGSDSLAQAEPIQVGAGTNWRTPTAGWGHTCATRLDNTAWCWGSNGSGQLGNGTTDATAVPWPVQ